MDHESPLERAKRLTQEEVNAGRKLPWVMGDYEARDRHNEAVDRRLSFFVIEGGSGLKSTSTL